MKIWDRADRQIRNMSEMMERLRLDPVAVAEQRLGLTLAHAIRTCQSCEAGEVCCDWLKRASVQLERPPAFCPNRQLFEDLLRDLPPASETQH
jgi:hypothetical protein